MTNKAYRELTDAQKYDHWKQYAPKDKYMARVRRAAMKQFKHAKDGK